MHVLAERAGVERMVKLASNEGAFGPLPASVAAYEAVASALHRYPDGGATLLRAALGERLGLPAGQVVPGNGADELIRLCGAAALDAGDAAVFPWPSFPSYLSAAGVHGADAVRVPLRDRAFDLDAVLEACSAPAPDGGRVRLVFLANPNNPTGTLLDPAALREFLAARLRNQAQDQSLDRSGGPGRRNLVIFDEHRVRLESDCRKILPEGGSKPPACGCAAPVEQARCGQQEGSAAAPTQSYTVQMQLAQQFDFRTQEFEAFVECARFAMHDARHEYDVEMLRWRDESRDREASRCCHLGAAARREHDGFEARGTQRIPDLGERLRDVQRVTHRSNARHHAAVHRHDPKSQRDLSH